MKPINLKYNIDQLSEFGCDFKLIDLLDWNLYFKLRKLDKDVNLNHKHNLFRPLIFRLFDDMKEINDEKTN